MRSLWGCCTDAVYSRACRWQFCTPRARQAATIACISSKGTTAPHCRRTGLSINATPTIDCRNTRW